MSANPRGSSSRPGPTGARFNIQPLKYMSQSSGTDAKAASEQNWKVLQEAIQAIYKQQHNGLSFEELYRSAYNMVLRKHGDMLYDGVETCLTREVKVMREQVLEHNGLSFLRKLNDTWKKHYKAVEMTRDILMYMDKQYVAQARRRTVEQLGKHLWLELLLNEQRVRDRLLSTLLGLVEDERRGETIDTQLCNATTAMLVTLGRHVYQSHFEFEFLRLSEEFYKREAQSLLQSCNCPQYLERAEKRLQEELTRVKQYLDPTTEQPITQVLRRELVQKHMDGLAKMEDSGMRAQLSNEQLEQLQLMHRCFEPVEGGRDLMRKLFFLHITEEGQAVVTEPENTKHPTQFVHRLLRLKQRMDLVIDVAFAQHKHFQQTLTQGFEDFLNKNTRSPEYLSLYIDEILRKGAKAGALDVDAAAHSSVAAAAAAASSSGAAGRAGLEEGLGGAGSDDVEVMLDSVMVLFRFLQDKDVFERYYKQHLAKRLLNGRQVSEDSERVMLSKLKQECGQQFTQRLEAMFNDVKMSKDLQQSFRDELKHDTHQLPLDLTVQVLTTGSWPTQSQSQCTLPQVLQQCCQRYADFYLRRHNGRKLTWQTNMGSADLKVQFASGRKELTVSTYQMLILMHFNDKQQLSTTELQQLTNIPMPDLKRNLHTLIPAKRQILIKHPDKPTIEDTDVFSFNNSFTSKQVKIKITHAAAVKETEPQERTTRGHVEQDRKPLIDAAIVRIMKARKVMEHNDIVAEVTQQLAARFKPDTQAIKKQLEQLIEREFLERDPNDRKKYRYLA